MTFPRDWISLALCNMRVLLTGSLLDTLQEAGRRRQEAGKELGGAGLQACIKFRPRCSALAAEAMQIPRRALIRRGGLALASG